MSEKWEWQPHPLDHWGQEFLIGIAHSANPPDVAPDEWEMFGNVTLPAKDGWQVTFFYDAGELDYIDSFTTPDGETLDRVWPADDYDDWCPVMCWRGIGDTERLLARIRGEEEAR